ncbi:MAG: type II CRISPR-associated endonuclease Cas1 [Bacteroidales bacterium]|nr:type II CRISPR-associated endonuclease Cas1 [Bacteroidales bacterium]
MLKRTLFFSKSSRLSTRDDQLIIELKETGEKHQAPIEDIGFLVLEHPQISFSMPLLDRLMSNNVGVVFCNHLHMPSSMLLNLDGHHLQGELFRHQLSATGPLKKNLWKQTVEGKIRNQARLLEKLEIPCHGLSAMADQVKSGDSTQREGVAARLYWHSLFGDTFVRERHGPHPNGLLNYGYTVLRAAVARALAGSGLLATLGIHHHNRYNAFALADDIMEPFRPFVDEVVYHIYTGDPDNEVLDIERKKALLELLTRDVVFDRNRRPLMVGLSQTTASLARAFSGEQRKIIYPLLE